jgi:hypothetical protein
MERPTGELSAHDNSVTVHTKLYEIKTVRIRGSAHKGLEETNKTR